MVIEVKNKYSLKIQEHVKSLWLLLHFVQFCLKRSSHCKLAWRHRFFRFGLWDRRRGFPGAKGAFSLFWHKTCFHFFLFGNLIHLGLNFSYFLLESHFNSLVLIWFLTWMNRRVWLILGLHLLQFSLNLCSKCLSHGTAYSGWIHFLFVLLNLFQKCFLYWVTSDCWWTSIRCD